MKMPVSVQLATLKKVQELLEFLAGRRPGWVYATELSHYCRTVAGMRRSYPNVRRLVIIAGLVQTRPIPFGGTARKYSINGSGLKFLADAKEFGLFAAYSLARKRLNNTAE